jgi:PadR family transcriptional regulator AphA
VYQMPRPVVYRCVGRLVDAGLVEPVAIEPGEGGPQRTVMRVTPAGRGVLRSWLRRPVGHVRDLRTALLAKLVLLDRSGSDPAPLLGAQRTQLVPIVAALASQTEQARDFDKTVIAWRYHIARAALDFLDDIDQRRATTS